MAHSSNGESVEGILENSFSTDPNQVASLSTSLCSDKDMLQNLAVVLGLIMAESTLQILTGVITQEVGFGPETHGTLY